MFGRRRRWRRAHWRCRNRRRRRWRFRLFKGLWCIPPQYCFQNQADCNQHENPWPPPSLPGQNGQTYQPHCPMQVAPGADQFSLLLMFAHSSSPSLASISQRLQCQQSQNEPSRPRHLRTARSWRQCLCRAPASRRAGHAPGRCYVAGVFFTQFYLTMSCCGIKSQKRLDR